MGFQQFDRNSLEYKIFKRLHSLRKRINDVYVLGHEPKGAVEREYILTYAEDPEPAALRKHRADSIDLYPVRLKYEDAEVELVLGLYGKCPVTRVPKWFIKSVQIREGNTAGKGLYTEASGINDWLIDQSLDDKLFNSLLEDSNYDTDQPKYVYAVNSKGYHFGRKISPEDSTHKDYKDFTGIVLEEGLIPQYVDRLLLIARFAKEP